MGQLKAESGTDNCLLPLMIKATSGGGGPLMRTSGGGGKGMRIVREE